jgi:hypothetical protein
VNIASPRPIVRADPCWSFGRRPARMEMKMILSMPKTISNTVRVASAIRLSGFSNQSIYQSSERKYSHLMFGHGKAGVCIC